MQHGKAQAYYSPSQDLINMPRKELFSSEEEYYACLWHEGIHYVASLIMPRRDSNVRLGLNYRRGFAA
ncbi:zincin-like metallopeptidase domain-containing protein [Planctomycetota bacterium]